MKQFFGYIITIILCSVIVFFSTMILFNKDTDYENELQKTVLLKNKIDSLEILNSNLNTSIQKHQDSIDVLYRQRSFLLSKIDTLNLKINSDNIKIKNNKQGYEQEIKRIDNFSDDELYQFFSKIKK